MKKVLSASLFSAALALTLTSCLKDKGFDNGEYGINTAAAPKGISFPEAVNEVNIKSVNYVDTLQVVNDPVISFETAEKAPKDIKVTLVSNPSLVADYNLAHPGEELSTMPLSLYSIPSLEVTIKKGDRFGNLKINILNATLLSLLETYGFGFTIASVNDNSYTIAANMKNIVIGINVKNRYDGRYQLKSQMSNWTSFGIINTVWTWPFGGADFNKGNIWMITSGGNSVKMFDPFGFGAYIHVARRTDGLYTGFGQTEPKFFFDLNTNKLIDATNDFPNPTNGRTFAVNPAVTTSRWDPNSRNIFAAILLKQPGRPDLQIFDTLTYKSER